jgi:negative regulator of flagellin synthesis FlgM
VGAAFPRWVKIEGIALKINNTVKPGSSAKVGQTTAKRSSGGATKTPRAAGSQEQVDIGPLSSQLQALETSLENVQVVDTARVEAIKQAISEGRFRVNPDVVADRLLTTVKDLVLNHKG